MKIRTRLLFFLLPTMLIGAILITSILSYNWYKEIEDGFKNKLKSAVVSCAALIDPDEIILKNQDIHLKSINPQTEFLYKDFNKIKEELKISSLYIVYVNPNETCISFLEAKDIYNLKKLTLINNEILKDKFSKNNFLLKNLVTKDILFTPPYKDKETSKKIITAYFPIKDENGNIIAYMAADMYLDLINKKLSEGLLLIILTSGIIITLMIISLFIIANKITKPVQRLNNSALFLAAGQYGNKIEIKGPKEIAELSNTINILSECLYEHINRLKENSIIKERMYGEYECSMLLQNHMLKKIIDENQSDSIAIDSINIYSHKPKGFLLDFLQSETENNLQIRLIEAKNQGFDGMYELLTNYKLFKENQTNLNKFSTLEIKIDKKLNIMNLNSNLFNHPFIWSINDSKFIDIKRNKTNLLPGDLFFVFNHGLFYLFENKENLKNTLYKVMKFFAQDGLETVTSMLKKELIFATKKNNFDDDIHLLCFQRLF
jgi:HAMP domain-containing protein